MTTFTAQDEAAFRAEISEFVRAELDPSVRSDFELGRSLSRQTLIDWQRKLVAHGWGAPHWPKDWGGTAWSVRQRFVFEEELALHGAPLIPAFNTRMIGPILLAYGSKEQKNRFLPRALNFDEWWCQGYSEPSSGSDLASLRTRAVRDGDSYVINGSKIWTTYGHYADWMFCLVRTDPDAKKQEGISFLLIDMKSPGIRVEPIRHFFGAHIFNQIFFEDVRVPVANRVGEENQGWTVAKSLLEHERLGGARHSEARRKLSRLRRILAEGQGVTAGLQTDRHWRSRVAQLDTKIRALQISTMRALEAMEETGAVGEFASVLKLKGVAVNQEVDEAIVDAVGPDALAADAGLDTEAANGLHPSARNAMEARYYFRGPAIAGGSSEVQRGIIAKRILGL
jgi:acyl-CoA dehydrogenase